MWFVHSIYGYDVFGSAFLSLRRLIEFFTFLWETLYCINLYSLMTNFIYRMLIKSSAWDTSYTATKWQFGGTKWLLLVVKEIGAAD